MRDVGVTEGVTIQPLRVYTTTSVKVSSSLIRWCNARHLSCLPYVCLCLVTTIKTGTMTILLECRRLSFLPRLRPPSFFSPTRAHARGSAHACTQNCIRLNSSILIKKRNERLFCRNASICLQLCRNATPKWCNNSFVHQTGV